MLWQNPFGRECTRLDEVTFMTSRGALNRSVKAKIAEGCISFLLLEAEIHS